jgi:hypothetical protein
VKTYIADTELALLLKTASQTGERLLVKAGEECYELKINPATEADDIWAGYDPEKVREAVERSAALGLHSDPDHIAAVIADIRSQRDQAPRPWER